MIGILGLQGTHEQIELRHPAQTLETGVFQEKRPAGKACADTPLQPLKGSFVATGERENASDLVIVVVRVPKRLWTGTGFGHAVERLFFFSRQRIKHAL